MNVTVLQINPDIIEEIKGAITEGVFTSRWALVETYHKVGQVLSEHEDEMPKNYIALVADELNQSERLIYQCRQFYKKFPDLSLLPDGKNISWHKIANHLLPAHKEKKLSPEELFDQKIKAFFQVKSITGDKRRYVKQVIEEWELFKKEK